MKPWESLEEVFERTDVEADDVPRKVWTRKELDERVYHDSRAEKSLENRYKERAA